MLKFPNLLVFSQNLNKIQGKINQYYGVFNKSKDNKYDFKQFVSFTSH